MKKLIAVLLLVVLSLCIMPACGAINKDGEVSVLWADLDDGFQFTVSDALDRGMYIENIKYTHYDAKGDANEQFKQAEDAIKNGACALVVRAVDTLTAERILKIAKDASLPIVFLCNGAETDEAIKSTLKISPYEKCFIVNEDFASLPVTLGEKISEDLLENYDDYDRDGNGVITYVNFSESRKVVKTINEKLTKEGKKELELVDPDSAELFEFLAEELEDFSPEMIEGFSVEDLIKYSVKYLFKDYNGKGKEKNATPVELFLTEDDGYIESLLLALREFELNHEKLVTHFIPVYTIGVDANAGKLIDSDKKEEKEAFSVMSVIDKGWISAAALQDDDTLALSTCKILANLIKGKKALEGIDSKLIKEGFVSVPYTIYE